MIYETQDSEEYPFKQTFKNFRDWFTNEEIARTEDEVYQNAPEFSKLINKKNRFITDEDIKQAKQYYTPGAFLHRAIETSKPYNKKHIAQKVKKYFGDEVKGDSLQDMWENLMGKDYKKSKIEVIPMRFTDRGEFIPEGLSVITPESLDYTMSGDLVDSESLEQLDKSGNYDIILNLQNMQKVYNANRKISPDIILTDSYDNSESNPNSSLRIIGKKGNPNRSKASDHYIGNAIDMGFGRGEYEKTLDHLLKYLSEPNNDNLTSQVILEFRDKKGPNSNWIHFTGTGENTNLKTRRSKTPSYYIYNNDRTVKRALDKNEFANHVLDFLNQYTDKD
jgi:hypothetical protein